MTPQTTDQHIFSQSLAYLQDMSSILFDHNGVGKFYGLTRFLFERLEHHIHFPHFYTVTQLDRSSEIDSSALPRIFDGLKDF
jgi:hypothetical protein